MIDKVEDEKKGNNMAIAIPLTVLIITGLMLSSGDLDDKSKRIAGFIIFYVVIALWFKFAVWFIAG